MGAEAGRPFSASPDGDVLVSVATLTELSVGVLLAGDSAVRAQRARTLRSAQRFVPLGYDERVAEVLARMIAALRTAGRRVSFFDGVIAATAAVHGLTVWTQDDDFEVIAEVAEGPPVLRA